MRRENQKETVGILMNMQILFLLVVAWRTTICFNEPINKVYYFVHENFTSLQNDKQTPDWLRICVIFFHCYDSQMFRQFHPRCVYSPIIIKEPSYFSSDYSLP